jgi:hypothetical protein
MKPHKHAEVIKAWADGAEIEFRIDSDCEWNAMRPAEECENDLGVPAFYTNYEYRRKDPYRELKEARAAGKVIQWYSGSSLNNTGEWCDQDGYCIVWYYPPERYRVKPEPTTKKVKLLAYVSGAAGELVWRKEGYFMTGWQRVPSEDKEIEVE